MPREKKNRILNVWLERMLRKQRAESTMWDMFNQFIHEHTRTVIEYISIFVA